VRIFVSYSRRDGAVTSETLRVLNTHLQGVSKTFIHCLCESESQWEQVRVLWALITSHAVLLVESPAIDSSRWVRLELRIARFIGLPLMRIKASDLVRANDA
jgi:hypothetical protein